VLPKVLPGVSSKGKAMAFKSAMAEVMRFQAAALPAHVGDWPPDQLEAYLERAAIIEYDARLPRAEAERRAEELVREAHRRSQERQV
jgi:regulator of protease activity HflC (stomatin/prohibitin superfamily)